MAIGERLKSWARSMTPWGFPLLYLGWAYFFWLPIFGSQTSVWQGTNLVLFLIGGASPQLAGLTMAWLTGGAERVRDLGGRLLALRGISLRWWMIIVLFWPVFDLVTAGGAAALGVTDRPIDIQWSLVTDPSSLLFVLVLGLLFPAVEEIGLRGYYLDRLQERFEPLVAGLINGTTWAIWHAAFVHFPGYYANTTYDPALWWWLPSIVLHTLIFVWIYNHTERSILAVVLAHALMNLTGEFLGLANELFPLQLPALVLVVVGLVASGQLSEPAAAPERTATDGE